MTGLLQAIAQKFHRDAEMSVSAPKMSRDAQSMQDACYKTLKMLQRETDNQVTFLDYNKQVIRVAGKKFVEFAKNHSSSEATQVLTGLIDRLNSRFSKSLHRRCVISE